MKSHSWTRSGQLRDRAICIYFTVHISKAVYPLGFCKVIIKSQRKRKKRPEEGEIKKQTRKDMFSDEIKKGMMS